MRTRGDDPSIVTHGAPPGFGITINYLAVPCGTARSIYQGRRDPTLVLKN